MGLYKSSKLFVSPFFDDISRIKDTFDNDLYQSSRVSCDRRSSCLLEQRTKIFLSFIDLWFDYFLKVVLIHDESCCAKTKNC